MFNLKNRLFYGWIIVAVTFVVLATGTLLWWAFSIFYVEILNEFGWGRANTAIIFSLGGIIYGISSPLAGILFDRLGPRKLFSVAALLITFGAVGTSQSNEIWQFCIFYGIVLALGVALVGFPPAVALVSNWFVRRRGTALGIAQGGLQGAFLIAPLIQLLIDTAGWRNAFSILGIAVFVIVAPLSIAFLRHRPQDMGLLPDGNTGDKEAGTAEPDEEDSLIVDRNWVSQEWTLGKALKTHRFWAIFVVVTAMAINFNIIITHQVAFIVDIGYTQMFAASLLVIFGAMSMAGRFFGFISDILGRELTYTLCNIGVVLALVLLILAGTTSSTWMLYAYMAFISFFFGLSTPTYGATVADIFHGKRFGSIVGFADLGWGLGTFLGSWLGGYIFDTFGSYTPAFITAIVAAVVASATLWIASPGKVRRVARRPLPRDIGE